MNSTIVRLGALVSWAGLALGCASQSTVAATYVSAKPALGDCELTLQVWARDIASEPVCIKRPERPVAVPDMVKLYFPKGDHHYYCEGSTTSEPNELESCAWNKHFRDKYPMTFRIASLGGDVSAQLRLIDVFRNGELAYRWDGAVGVGTTVTIAGERLTKDGMPNQADFDLRLYPAGLEISDSILSLEVERVRNRNAERFVGVASAAFVAIGIPAALKPQYEALLCDVNRVRVQAAAFTGAPLPTPLPGTPAPGSPNACSAVPGLPTPGTLLDRYSKAKAGGTQALTALETQLETDIATSLGTSLASVKAAAEALSTKVAATPAVQNLTSSLSRIDGLVQSAVQTVDDVSRLASDLNQQAQSVLKDPAKQAQLYAAIVHEAQTQGDPFDPYHANPAPTGREVPLHMAYYDTAQWYLVSVWNGAAFRSNDLRTTPGVAYAVPILDVVGQRWKWNRSRWAEFRIAAGAMMFEDRKRTAEADVKAEDGKLRGAAHVNVGIGPYRMGVAWVPAASGEGEVPVRILVGADLYKLLFGQDLQVASE
jgi:hypothetical protein